MNAYPQVVAYRVTMQNGRQRRRSRLVRFDKHDVPLLTTGNQARARGVAVSDDADEERALIRLASVINSVS